MTFQMSDHRVNHFLKLLDNKYLSIKLIYIKGSSWLKQFSYLNFLYIRATRAIINYTPMKEYCLRFFPRINFKYLCELYPIESKQHILYEYRKYNKYWNSNKVFLNHFVAFLEYNPRAFSFYKEIS